jgi:isopentenyl-diphosphate delta-isomerase
MPAPGRTSLIDAVNDRDEPIGLIARGEALEAGASFRTAHVFVLNEKRDLLLQKLAARRERHPCRWGSSVAAYLNSGEDYEQAASRRLYEELGLILPLRPLGKLRMRDEHSLKFVSLYLGVNGDTAIREPDHIEEIAYWPQAQVRSLVEEDPGQFTPTFRELYRAFGSDLSE